MQQARAAVASGGGPQGAQEERQCYEDEELSFIEPVYATRTAMHPAPKHEYVPNPGLLQACPQALAGLGEVAPQLPACQPCCMPSAVRRRMPRRTMPAYMAKALVEDMLQMDFNPRSAKPTAQVPCQPNHTACLCRATHPRLPASRHLQPALFASKACPLALPLGRLPCLAG